MNYPIDLSFDESWPSARRSILEQAADRWRRVITRPLSPIELEGRRVDGVVVRASIVSGPAGDELARVGVDRVRPESAARGALLPASSVLSIDEGDFAILESDGRIEAVLAHEIGHCLGIGTVWAYKNLLRGVGRSDVRFVGKGACREYASLCGREAASTPVENRGGAGSASKHWRETVFGNELMSTLVPDADNRLSRLTIASLEDLGYDVDYSLAEPYVLGQEKMFDFTLPSGYVPRHKRHEVETEVLPDSSLLPE